MIRPPTYGSLLKQLLLRSQTARGTIGRGSLFVYLVCFVILFFASSVCADQLTTIDAALKKSFKSFSDYDIRAVVLTPQQQADISQNADVLFGESHHASLRLYTVKDNGRIAGYVFEDQVIGKWGPIHYAVSLSPDGKIIEVTVLDYQEIRGKPVAKNRFLKQYKNKTVQNPLKLRKDIDGVTGATISSRSLTDGVRKILYIFEMIKDSLPR